FSPLAAPMLPEDFPRRPMRSLVAIKRDRAWRPPLVLERSPEKRLGGRDIPLGAEQEIDSLSLLVDRAIEVSPAAFDLHVGFIDPPGSASSACEAVPTLFEFRNIALDPAHDRRMGQRNPAFDHHFHEIAKAELNRRYHRTQRMMISRSKWRPLKRSSMFSIRVRALQRGVHAKYAVLLPFAPEPFPQPPRTLNFKRTHYRPMTWLGRAKQA